MVSDTVKLDRQLRPLGLQQRPINGDGNCMFRGYSDQMLGHDRDHALYRLQAALYVEENAEEFREYIAGGERGFQRRLRRMRVDGVFGDHVELMALARQDNVIICVHQLNVPVERIYPTLGGLEPPAGTRQVHLGYVNGDHYNSVREIGDDSADPTSINLDAVGVMGRILSPLRIVVPDEDCLFFNPTTADYTKIPAGKSSNSSSTCSLGISSKYSIGSYENSSDISEEDEVPSPDPSEIELVSAEESDFMSSSDDCLRQPPYRCWRCAWYYPNSTTFYKWYVGFSKTSAIEAAKEHLKKLNIASRTGRGGCTDGELLEMGFVFNPEEAKEIPLLEAQTRQEAYDMKARCRRQLGATGCSANYYASRKLDSMNDEIIRAFKSDPILEAYVKERPEWHVLPHGHNLQVSNARPKRKQNRIPDSQLSPGSLQAVLWIRKIRSERRQRHWESLSKEEQDTITKKRAKKKTDINRKQREHRLENNEARLKQNERSRNCHRKRKSALSEDQRSELNKQRREHRLKNNEARLQQNESSRKSHRKRLSAMSEDQRLELNRKARKKYSEKKDTRLKHNENDRKCYRKRRSAMSEDQRSELNRKRRVKYLANKERRRESEEGSEVRALRANQIPSHVLNPNVEYHVGNNEYPDRYATLHNPLADLPKVAAASIKHPTTGGGNKRGSKKVAQKQQVDGNSEITSTGRGGSGTTRMKTNSGPEVNGFH